MTNHETQYTRAGTSRFVTTPGWRLHYHEAGPADASPVLFLHGSGPGASAWANFRLNIDSIAAHHRVLMLDQPGWGRSDPMEQSEGGHAAALLQFLDALGIERVTLVGNSLGGVNSVAFTVAHPERVERLVTMGTPDISAPDTYSPAGYTLGLGEVYRGYSDRTVEGFRRLVDVMTFDDRFLTDELIEERLAEALQHEHHLDAFLARAQSGNQATPWTPADLAAITQETLVIHGRDDRVVTLEAGMRLFSRIPNSRALIFNQCGHWTQIERAAEFNTAVLDFLAPTRR